jgi:hypothetical protein
VQVETGWDAFVKKKVCPKCETEKDVEGNFGYRPYGNSKGDLYLRSYCLACERVVCRRFRNSPRGKENRRFQVRHGSRYCCARRDAKYKGMSFTLTREEYLNFRDKPCHYCGGQLPETGLGLDRIDNSKGYTLENVLPCCRWCNTARSNIFTTEEMKLLIGSAIRQVRESRQRRLGDTISSTPLDRNGENSGSD